MNKKLTDEEVERLWDELEDVPFDWNENNDLYLTNDWHWFKAGTDRMELWEWFDKNHSKGVAWLLHERNTEKIKKVIDTQL